MLRDELQAIDDPSAVRLATQIDVVATMLLARPYIQACGQFALPMTSDRCSSTFRESWNTCWGGSFAKLQFELSIGE